MSEDSLIKMANDIGNFFRAEPDREKAVSGIVDHIAKFWTHRMQDKLVARAAQADAGLDELPREAVGRLAAKNAARSHQAGA
jgi:formate dehydrogenase subunit delta